MEPVNVSDPNLWNSLGAIFGPGGLALLIALAASLYFTLLMWKRLKEKDDECNAEMEKAEVRWEARFQQMRADIKEGFQIVAALTQQVTISTAKARGTRTP